jgi:hypothetical protein
LVVLGCSWKKLKMIDGADVHAVMFLIALMFYNGHSRTVAPTFSLA